MTPLIKNSLKALAFLFVITLANQAFAQESIFTPAIADVSLLKKLFEKHETSFKQSLSSLPSANKTDYENIYKERWNYIKQKFDNKEIYTNSIAQKWLDALVQEIIQANAILKGQSFQCYFSRSRIHN